MAETTGYTREEIREVLNSKSDTWRRSQGYWINAAESLLYQVDELRAALEWYAERARSLAGKMGAVKSQREADYVMAVLTELSLDAGRRAAKVVLEK